MGGWTHFWEQGDAVSRTVAVALLAMSIAAWVLILWKARTMSRARHDIARGVGLYWSAPDVAAGRNRVTAVDRELLLLPLLDAVALRPAAGTLESQADSADRVTRHLRDALHAGLSNLRFGQVALASIGSTAPFVGLFGTVWGIYHALVAVSAEGTLTIERVAGPVGEALVMTAAGLAVAIPAVLAYNFFGQRLADCEAELEGFAHDLRAWHVREGDASTAHLREPAGRARPREADDS
jgi:biopolymer transport protein ExbB